MGVSKWRLAEEDFLQSQYTSLQIQEIFSQRSGNFISEATGIIYAQYKVQFKDPFTAETDQEFAARRAKHKRAKKLEQWVAETVDEGRKRVDGAHDVRSYLTLMRPSPALFHTPFPGSAFVHGYRRRVRVTLGTSRNPPLPLAVSLPRPPLPRPRPPMPGMRFAKVLHQKVIA